MLKLDSVSKRFNDLAPVLLSDLGLKEREHLQESICNSPEAFFRELEEELLIIGSEVVPSGVVGDRIDVLAVEPDGATVIIELKRGSNKWQLLQALSYAAMISKWPTGEEFLQKVDRSRHDDIKKYTRTAELNKSQRIILVAEAYDYEVLVTAEWLNKEYDADTITCYQISVATDKNADAQYMSCMRIYPQKDLAETAKQRTRVNSVTVLQDWESILSRTNQAVALFFRDRLEHNCRTNSRNNALAYPQIGTIHWYLEPRPNAAWVYQVGRFNHSGQSDQAFWMANLSNADVANQKGGTCLRFYLREPSDFEFFQKATETLAATFSWGTGGPADEETAAKSESAAASGS